MVRHARMLGRPALFLPGLDHASIAAQFVLDGILAKEGESRATPRPGAVPRADAPLHRGDEDCHPRPAAARRRQLRLEPPPVHDGRGQQPGRPRGVPAAVSQGLAYRAEALINWCPGCRTSVSDLEVIPPRRRARSGASATTWWTRPRAPRTRTRPVTVATTRPETILGDTAVAVHPDDPRYAALVGRRVRSRSSSGTCRSSRTRRWTPPSARRGQVTPAHDHDDNETGRRHGLAMPTILDDAAHVANTGTAYDGLERYAAQDADPGGPRPPAATSRARSRTRWSSAVASAATSRGAALKTQWFIRTGPLAEAALEATRPAARGSSRAVERSGSTG